MYKGAILQYFKPTNAGKKKRRCDDPVGPANDSTLAQISDDVMVHILSFLTVVDLCTNFLVSKWVKRSACNALKKSEFVVIFKRHTSSYLAFVEKYCPKMKCMLICGLKANILVTRQAALLETLGRLETIKPVACKAFRHIGVDLKRMKHLSAFFQTQEDIKYFPPKCPNLETLELSGSKVARICLSMKYVFQCCSKLVAIRVPFYFPVKLLSMLPHLRSLFIADLNDDRCRELVKVASKLEEIGLLYPELTLAGCELIGSLSTLKKLTVGLDCTGAFAAHFVVCIEQGQFSQLRYLETSFVSQGVMFKNKVQETLPELEYRLESGYNLMCLFRSTLRRDISNYGVFSGVKS